MSQVLNILYNKENSFSDIIIELENGKKIFCHKNILGAQSEVFQKMFSSKMKEGESKIEKIKGDPISIEIMLKNMYCKKENLSLENVVGVFVVSHQFQFDSLTQECQEFILNNVSNENAPDLFQISKQYQWTELREKCLNLMFSEFEKIKNIGELSLEDLTFILNSGEINLENEASLFHKIEEWVLFDEKERMKMMFTLLDLIDYVLIDFDNILNLASEKFESNDSLKIYLFDILKKKSKGTLKSIVRKNVVSNFTFEKYFGKIEISSKGKTVIHSGGDAHSSVITNSLRNQKGTHSCRFLINKLGRDYWISFGIINPKFLDSEHSHSLKTNYSLSSESQKYISGKLVNFEGMAFKTNDIIKLELNFNKKQLSIHNETSKTQHVFSDIPIDEYCFHLNIYDGNSKVTIL
jgi:hypothetical protein